MKKLVFQYRHKKGYIVLTVTSIISFLTFFTIIRFAEITTKEYQIAIQKGNYLRAKNIGLGGLEVIISTLKVIPLDILYDYGLLPESPVVPLKNEEEGITEEIYMKYKIYEETGKINANLIVNLREDRKNAIISGMLERLSEILGIDSTIWNGLVDYIDPNDATTEPGGYEVQDYEELEPKRKIKNNRLHSLDELLLIPGFSQKLLYHDLRTEVQKEIYQEKLFTIEEKSIIDEEKDFILAENITVYLPYQAAGRTIQDVNQLDKINVNSAGINVIMSLSKYMTEDIAKKILLKRLELGGRFKTKEEIGKIPALQKKTEGEISVYDRIAEKITIEDRMYKMTVESIYQEQSATIVAVYDFKNKHIISYFE